MLWWGLWDGHGHEGGSTWAHPSFISRDALWWLRQVSNVMVVREEGWGSQGVGWRRI